MEQHKSIRKRVLKSIQSIQRGQYRDYYGRTGLKELANAVKREGRKLLAQAEPKLK